MADVTIRPHLKDNGSYYRIVMETDSALVKNTDGTNVQEFVSSKDQPNGLASLNAEGKLKQTLSAIDVNAVPITRTINGHQLDNDVILNSSDTQSVPTTRTINGHALSSNVTLTAGDIGVTGGLYVGSSAPYDTGKGWIDTTIGGVLKYYNGSTWVVAKSVWG